MTRHRSEVTSSQVFFFDGSNSVGYIRPMRGAHDVNVYDFFQGRSQSALELTIHLTGGTLAPTVHASRVKRPPQTPSSSRSVSPTPLQLKSTTPGISVTDRRVLVAPSESHMDRRRHVLRVGARGRCGTRLLACHLPC